MKTSFKYLTLLIAGLASSCTLLMSSDFDKAIRLAEINIGVLGKVNQILDIPAGDAMIVIAVPNYRCSSIDATAKIRVLIEGHGVILVDTTMTLSQLTWSHGVDSCHAYGYSYDKAAGLTQKVDIPKGSRQMNISIETISSGNTGTRTGAVWLVYGGRAPTARMFEGK